MNRRTKVGFSLLVREDPVTGAGELEGIRTEALSVQGRESYISGIRTC